MPVCPISRCWRVLGVFFRYCQGLNRIAAFLLLVLDEERAFWGLVGIVERHMGYEYYTDPLIVARADLSIFKVLHA